MSVLRVGVVGCGLIGAKRAAAISGASKVTAVCDRDAQRTRALAQKTGATPCDTLDALLEAVDAVIVATTNDQLVPVALRAVSLGKHVLLEKPGARTVAELESLAAKAKATGAIVRVGYNHRFHRSAIKAREILDSGSCGPVMFVRARYGHGGRIGYDKEWRADREVSGGGELIDQGVHLIDLARWYIGQEFAQVHAQLATFFWDMPVEDNAFLTLTTASNQIASLHASCTEWKNLFSFEIYARDAKLHLEGLGGSYGTERLYHYIMAPEMGPPDTVIYEYPGADASWTLEWKEFLQAIESPGNAPGARIGADLVDALAALTVVQAAYSTETSRFDKTALLPPA